MRTLRSWPGGASSPGHRHAGDRDRGTGQGHRRRPLRVSSTRPTASAYALPGPVARSPAGASAPIDAERGARAMPGRARRALRTATRRALASADGRRAGSSSSRPRSPTAARSSPRSSPTRWRTRAPRPAPVRVDYDRAPHDVVLRADHPGLYTPDKVNPACPPTPRTATSTPRWPAAAARGRRDLHARRRSTTTRWSRTPRWRPGTRRRLTLYDSTQGASATADTIAAGARPRPPSGSASSSPHVGGGLRVQGHDPAARRSWPRSRPARAGRPVRLALDPAADVRADRLPHADHPAGPRSAPTRDGRLTAIAHDVVEQTSTLQRVRRADRRRAPAIMYARARPAHHAPAGPRSTCPTPSWMRAPGETPGMFALESAMDELAVALRPRPDRAADPQRAGRRPGERPAVQLAATWSRCLREGAEPLRLGAAATRGPGVRRDGRWLIGTGVAASTYPARRRPSHGDRPGRGRRPLRRAHRRRRHRHRRPDRAHPDRGRRRSASAPEQVAGRARRQRAAAGLLAGGSMGTASWGSAVVKACERAC